MNTLEELIERVGDPDVLQLLKKIQKLLGQYDYDAAAALLNELKA
jgi:hypothetical protein